MLIRPSSAMPRTTRTSSLRRSSVSGGKFRRITWPSLLVDGLGHLVAGVVEDHGDHVVVGHGSSWRCGRQYRAVATGHGASPPTPVCLVDQRTDRLTLDDGAHVALAQ